MTAYILVQPFSAPFGASSKPLKEEDFYERSEKPIGLPGAAHEYPSRLLPIQIAG
jgi:hypothetical protein